MSFLVPVSKRTYMCSQWREHERNYAKLKDGIFELLAHPEATPEQLAQAREMAIRVQAKHNEAKLRMQQEGYL